MTALKGGYVDCTEVKTGAWSRDDAKGLIVKEGDFLIGRGNGSLRLVGRGGLVRQVDREVAYPDTMIRALLAEESGIREFVGLIWDSPFVRQQIERRARTSAGIYKVAQGDLQGICLPLPTQEEVMLTVELTERAQSICEAATYQLEAGARRSAVLRQAILKRAFEGKLVPQDPKDEPADELLARIRAARNGVDGAAVGKRARRVTKAG